MNVESETLQDNELPKYDLNDNPTGCCPRFDPTGWDDREIHFRNKRFVEATTRSVMHVPLNMGRVFKNTFEAIEGVDALDKDDCIVLSRELSPWKAEHFFAVTKDVPGQKMVHLSGDYHTKVFEGPFSDARKWCEELRKLGSREGHEPGELFFFYTTCPKCAKHYGKNYVVGLVSPAKP